MSDPQEWGFERGKNGVQGYCSKCGKGRKLLPVVGGWHCRTCYNKELDLTPETCRCSVKPGPHPKTPICKAGKA